ncbi:4-coumarate--coa ligase-like 7 [Quercus suber]|uniref:4-coumarate--coa ligase-like 7 n=1 Tax=Quercus suber TaxID=58331 RepID=A0AAW0LZ85_QUESU|nr:4-coumarate--coa ligase-like 7 [Quercus suber]
MSNVECELPNETVTQRDMVVLMYSSGTTRTRCWWRCIQLRRGDMVVSMGKFDLEKVLWVVEKYRVTHLCMVPPMMVELVKQSTVMKKYDLSSLK